MVGWKSILEEIVTAIVTEIGAEISVEFWAEIGTGTEIGAEIGAEIGVTVKDFNGIGENRKTARDLIRKIATSNLGPVLTSRFFNFH